MIVNHYQYSAESMLENKTFEEGAIYFIQDTQHIYIDPIGGTERIKIANDINILSTEADRIGLLSPIPGKFYFVLDTSKYYIYYNGTWYAGGGNTTPRAGLIYINPSTTLPDGFLWCDGAPYSRTEYPELFAAIGTHYGSGDNSTTFNVPDLTTRVPIGAGKNYTLGDTGGDEGDAVLLVNQSNSTTSIDTSTHLYTVVNYIISTGKGAETLSTAEIIASMQVLPLGIEYGGTSATDPATALSNLGGASVDYVDNKIASIEAGVSEEYVNNAIQNATENMVVDVPTLQEHLASEKMVLSSLQYGTELPTTGVEGQVFFKIIT